MMRKKYDAIRITLMTIGLILNIGFIACCIIAILNSTNVDLIKVLTPIIISYSCFLLVIWLFFQKLFCGFFCGLGLLQDLLWKLTNLLHLPKFPRGPKIMKVINVFSKFLLVVFILALITLMVLLFFPDILSGVKIPMFIFFTVPVIFLTFTLMARRFFCNICPFGSFIGLFHKIGTTKLKKNVDNCIYCGACYEVCPMRIKSIFIESKKNNITTSSCIFCGECIKKCPQNDALSITVLGKTFVKSNKQEFLKDQYDTVKISEKSK